MSEAIKNLTENVAIGFGREGSEFMVTKYTDIIHPQKEPTRTADEIIDEIKQKLRGYE